MKWNREEGKVKLTQSRKEGAEKENKTWIEWKETNEDKTRNKTINFGNEKQTTNVRVKEVNFIMINSAACGMMSVVKRVTTRQSCIVLAIRSNDTVGRKMVSKVRVKERRMEGENN